MKIIDEIKTVCEGINPAYTFYYEDAKMMNLKADEMTPACKFVYLDEFRRGEIKLEAYQWVRQLTVNLYFGGFVPLDADAVTRQELLELINTEMVFPFISQYKELINSKRIQFLTPPPQFDANEVSWMLQFDLTEYICL